MKLIPLNKIVLFFIAICISALAAHSQEQKKPSERSYNVELKKIKDQLAKRKAERLLIQTPNTNSIQSTGINDTKPTMAIPVNTDKLKPGTGIQLKPSERKMIPPTKPEKAPGKVDEKSND